LAGNFGGEPVQNLFSVQDKSVLITGGSSGLGLQLVRLFSSCGAKVCSVATHHEPQICDGLLAGAPAHPPRFTAANLREDEGIALALDESCAANGVPDIVFNNAGVTLRKRFLEIDRSDWDHLMDINLRAMFFLAQEAAKRMIAVKKHGSIINMASILASKAMTGTAAYSTAKAGISQMTRSMALELGPQGIRVNAIAPGWFETRMTASFLTDPAKAYLSGVNPLRRLGSEGDLDGAALLLASDAGRYITGATITVDGGQSLTG
jgi:2-dehydro-3-deoxy-D-gluconate 5-dehydrogenase